MSITAPVLIGCGEDAGAAAPVEDIGFKAHNLARMAALGLPVPPAFVLGTAWCARAADLRREHWSGALARLESACGLAFGDARRPLLVSVRSGAPASMPGMLETVLNVGLSDATLPGLVRLAGNPRLAWDAYRRLVAGYGDVVMGVPARAFEADLAAVCGGEDERELDYAQLRDLARRHLETVRRECGRAFPQDPIEQLEGSIGAVFASWHSERARTWRQLRGLPDAMGTAVTVQRMVFGNAGGSSGAGVGFTRHPSTGEAQPWVDFLFDAQGEDVVSGRRSAPGHEELASVLPRVWEALIEATRTLERGLGDMQDFEFTVEQARLYLLQTRTGKRTAQAAVRIALDLFDEGIISREQALARTGELDAQRISQLQIAPAEGEILPQPLAQATSACTGVVSGPIALDEAAAREAAVAGRPPILVRAQAETADIAALDCAAGLLTQRGARTSHAAVVARQLGKVCLVACEALEIDLPAREVRLGGRTLREGESVSLDGNTGTVYAGAVHTVRVEPSRLLRRLAELRDPPAPAIKASY
ncbi:MAG: pyruvate, phosphate dikinase [Burkholderiales bacterium]|nr:pyruvate, phosphate dikinase [Burkholderiales bacterium]